MKEMNSAKEKKVKVVVIGAGTAGLYALGQIRKATDDYLLINSGFMGTTCARTGCMPSKQLIRIADNAYRRTHFAGAGVVPAAGEDIDTAAVLAHVRRVRDKMAGGVIETTEKKYGKHLLEGQARFLSPTLLEVEGKKIRAERIIIATGSSPVIPEEWQRFGNRVLTSDTIFEQEDLPGSVAVVGLGPLGVEMSVTLRRLGISVTAIHDNEMVAGLNDPLVAAESADILRRYFPLWLNEKARLKDNENRRLLVEAGKQKVEVDAVIASMGRRPNLQGLGLENLGVELDKQGVPYFNPSTMQIEGLPVFIAGDVTGRRAVLHEAADEGRIAGHNCVHPLRAFRRKPPLQIIFCHPDIARVGKGWADLDLDRTAIGDFWLRSSGRAVLMEETEGLIRIYADRQSRRIIGAALVAAEGEHLAHLLAWSVCRRMTVEEMLSLPYYHPTLEEALQSTLYDLRNDLGSDRREAPVELEPLN